MTDEPKPETPPSIEIPADLKTPFEQMLKSGKVFKVPLPELTAEASKIYKKVEEAIKRLEDVVYASTGRMQSVASARAYDGDVANQHQKMAALALMLSGTLKDFIIAIAPGAVDREINIETWRNYSHDMLGRILAHLNNAHKEITKYDDSSRTR